MISQDPNQLHIFNPAIGSGAIVPLSKAPLSMSLSTDGLGAAVGFADSVALVNLSNATVEKTLPSQAPGRNVVLAAEWVHIVNSPGGSIRISDGTYVPVTIILGNSRGARLSADGKTIYSATEFSTYLQVYNVSTGPITAADGLFGITSICTPFSLSSDKTRVHTGCNIQEFISAQPGIRYVSSLFSDTRARVRGVAESAKAAGRHIGSLLHRAG
ncbi:MAG: hypothetical protein R2762_15440 [Bryobacteraceae bacterium]